jgi:ribosome-binding factor A
MRFFRSERVGSLIQAELSKLLIREVDFPDGALVTIVSVDVDKKMERAKVGLSVLPSGREADALRAVTARAGELQFLLMRKLNVKPMPRLLFFIDHGNQHAAEIEKMTLREQGQEGENSGLSSTNE